MKKIIVLCFAICFLLSCNGQKKAVAIEVKADSTAYYKAKCDTALFLASQYEKHLIIYEIERRELVDSIQVLNENIVKLNNRPLMTKTQFLYLYRYDRVKKYYKICINKPSQWKYIKGWLRRAIEE